MLMTAFSSLSINAQETIHRTCATQDVVTKYLLDNYTLEELKGSTPYTSNAKKAEGNIDYTVSVVNSDTVYTIQVVVHVVYLDDNKYENPSDALIQSQIDALNRDFNLENSIDHVRPEFLQFIGNAKIRFELAKVQPNGKLTNGIERKKSKPIIFPDWSPILDNIKNGRLGGLDPWKPKEYLNIWVCDLNMVNRLKPTEVEVDRSKGLLGGIANPPIGLPNWIFKIGGVQQNLAITEEFKQGVVVDFRFFGQNPEYVMDYFNGSPNYIGGRTTVHEVGHYLGLRHSWGDGQAYAQLFGGDECLDYDDGIKDTPSEKEPYSTYAEPGNPCGVNANSCNVPYPGDGIDYPDMRENYMNYSTDLCYGMFTKEQVNMMRFALTDKRSGVIVKREAPVPTTIKNRSSLDAMIYPNPSHGIININLNSVSKEASKVVIYNTLGEQVKAQVLSSGIQNAEINIKNIAAGSYIVQIQRGSESIVKQLIVQ